MKQVCIIMWEIAEVNQNNLPFNFIFTQRSAIVLSCIMLMWWEWNAWHDVNYIMFVCAMSHCDVCHCIVRTHTAHRVLHHTVTHEWNTFIYVNNKELMRAFIIISSSLLTSPGPWPDCITAREWVSVVCVSVQVCVCACVKGLHHSFTTE